MDLTGMIAICHVKLAQNAILQLPCEDFFEDSAMRVQEIQSSFMRRDFRGESVSNVFNLPM
jgi:hypothetical protein